MALLSAMFSVMPALAAYGVQTKISHCVANQASPDLACTPGAILTTNTSVVCTTGYTKTVRNVSTATKKKVFAEYGIPYSQHSNYEVDHLISLELGGGNDISNLWPESYLIRNGSLIKDTFENYLHSQVCKGKITIQEAQAEISGNWLKYYLVWKGIKTTISSTLSLTSATTTPASLSSVSKNAPPSNATAECADKTYYFNLTHQGACSHHGGVLRWYK